MYQPSQNKDQPKITYRIFSVDLNCTCNTNLFTIENVKQFFLSNFKIIGNKNKTPDSFKISSTGRNDKRKNSVIIKVDNKLTFSKKYIKYLVKKFLRREGLGRFFTVTLTSTNIYAVKMIKKTEEIKNNNK